MADKIPLKGIFNGSGDPTGLAEFTTSDTIGFADGGTGLSALGTAGQVIKVNSGASALEFGNVADIINLDGANDLTSVTLELTDIFLVSDFAGLLLGFISNISYLTLFALALVPLSLLVLWFTPLGLQMRSVGEYPAGSESLGVNVYLMKYIGVTISGALSGLAGSYLVVAGTGIYLEGQTGGRGFIGLASMLFGNYKPFGILMGSGLFGFADALQLRSPQAVHGLLIIISVFLLVLTFKAFYEKKYKASIVTFIFSVSFLIWFMNSTSIPNQFVYFTPHITTLIVLSFANQRIKLPEKIGVPYKKGEIN